MNVRPPSGLILSVLFTVFLLISPIPSQKLQANPRVDADVAMFYDALKPYGEWVSHSIYGTVWYPRDVPRHWRPYTDGHWAYTHQYGWLWVSEQPWGWAPFHYGRWAWDDWYGWIWVPGRVWAPAWVFWRYGGGYAAWAPMPPNVLWQPHIGLNTQYFDYDRDLHWDCWVAVPQYHLPHRGMRNHILAPNQNRHIISMTNNLNPLTVINQTIVNQGIPVTRIEQVSGVPVVPVIPVVKENIEKHHRQHQNDETPEIIRPNSSAPSTPEEIRKHERLATELDQEKKGRLQTPSATESHLTSTDNQAPRIPGRLSHEHASTKSLHGPGEQPLTEPTEPIEQISSPDTASTPLLPEPNSQTPSSLILESPVNLSPPNESIPSESTEKSFEQQPVTTSLPGFEDQHPIEEKIKVQPVQMSQEPLVDQPSIRQIPSEEISSQEIIQPINMDKPQQEGTVVQEVQIQQPLTVQPQESIAVPEIQNQPPVVEVQNRDEPVREAISPVQIPQEPQIDQQPIPPQEISHQEPIQEMPAQTDMQQQDFPVVQETQAEERPMETPPQEPLSQPEMQTQPPVEIQQQPEPPHQEAPPVQQQEAVTPPENPCQATEQSDCSK